MSRPLDPKKIVMAKQRLVTFLGAEEAAKVWTRASRAVPGGSLRSAQDLQYFAESMMRSGGLAEVVGRSLSMHALLCGAKKRDVG